MTAALVLLLLVGVTVCQRERLQVCALKPVDSLLEQSRTRLGFHGEYFPSPEAESLTVSDDRRKTLWMGARWYGPEDGAVLVLSCDGHVLAVRTVGAVHSLRAGPDLPDVGLTVLAEVNPGGGTGVRWRRLLLLAFRRDTVDVVWSTATLEADYSLPTKGGSEVLRRVAFSPAGDSIYIAGMRRTLRYDDKAKDWVGVDSQAIAAERLCWAGAERAYRPCR